MGSSLIFLQPYEEHGEAFLRRTVTGDKTWVFLYTPGSKTESMTWKHPHCPVKKKFETLQSQGKVMATVFWDVYGFLFGWFHTSRFNEKWLDNVLRYLMWKIDGKKGDDSGRWLYWSLWEKSYHQHVPNSEFLTKKNCWNICTWIANALSLMVGFSNIYCEIKICVISV